MARQNRMVLLGLPHFVLGRGRGPDPIFRETTDYRVFLHLLSDTCGHQGVAVLGYCLMPHFYQLILLPENDATFDWAMRRVEMEYAHYHNLRHMVTGPVWSSSYQFAGLSWEAVWDAMAYLEREPVRSKAVGVAWGHSWSTAAARVERAARPSWVRFEEWAESWDAPRWMRRLQGPPDGDDAFRFRLEAALSSGALMEAAERMPSEAVPRAKRSRIAAVAGQ